MQNRGQDGCRTTLRNTSVGGRVVGLGIYTDDEGSPRGPGTVLRRARAAPKGKSLKGKSKAARSPGCRVREGESEESVMDRFDAEGIDREYKGVASGKGGRHKGHALEMWFCRQDCASGGHLHFWCEECTQSWMFQPPSQKPAPRPSKPGRTPTSKLPKHLQAEPKEVSSRCRSCSCHTEREVAFSAFVVCSGCTKLVKAEISKMTDRAYCSDRCRGFADEAMARMRKRIEKEFSRR